jgi:tRNA(His) 5'-end guanylyltransferase
MANKDSLGDRMKENYEGRFKFKLMRRTPVIIRIDGKAFHTFTRGFNKPFDKVLSNAMDRTMYQLCENIQGCVFGYTQSDEITLILNDYKTFETSAWFDYEIQKICSIAASMATAYFNRNFFNEVDNFYEFINDENFNEKKLKEYYFVDNYDVALKLYDKYSKAIEKMAMFDARCFNIPESEVTNCTIWRQQDCTRNSVEMVGRTYFSDKELFKKNCSNIQDMLMNKYNINWNDFPVRYKRGCACYKMNVTENETSRSKWVVDYEMPIITQDREYVEKWIRLNNDENKKKTNY